MTEKLQPCPFCGPEGNEFVIYRLKKREVRMIACVKELYNICRFWLMTEKESGLIINPDIHLVMQKTYDYINGNEHEENQ